MDQPTSETAAAIAKKRRNRAIYSCAECRRRKIACSKAYPRPCSTCVRLSKTCVYLPAPRATPKTTSSSGDGSSSSPSASIETESTTFTQPLQDGRKSSLTAQSTDWCISPSTGDLTDICLRVGRLIISERLGGLSRIDTLEGLNVMEQGVSTRMDVDVSSMHKTMSAPVVAWFKPLPMTNLLSPPLSKGDPKDEYFPSRTECDQLLDHYFAAIDPVVHLVYRPYIKQDVDELYERNPARTTSSSKSLILAMCFTSASSLSHIQTQQLLNIRKAKLVEKLKIATEASLQRADVLALNWTDYKLLQAILIYLVRILHR